MPFFRITVFAASMTSLVRYDPLQSGVLGLQLPKALDVVGLYAAVLSPPNVEGVLRDPMLPAHLADRLCARGRLREDPRYLLLAVP